MNRPGSISAFVLLALISLQVACSKAFPLPDVFPILAILGDTNFEEQTTTATNTATTYTVGGTVSGLTGTMVLSNNGTDGLTVTSNGTFTFSQDYGDGSAYTIAVFSVSGTQACTVSSDTGTIASANVTSVVVSCFSEHNPASVPAVVTTFPLGSTTGQATCTGTTCRARLYLYFDQSMDSTLTPTVTATINATAIAVAITNHTWFATTYVDDSVEVVLSWVHFPTNSTPTFTFSQIPLQDKGGTMIAADYSFSFSTGDGFRYQLADSGQTDCSDGATLAACPHGTTGQDADYANIPAARSFSAPDNSTFAADYTTTDNVTGLTWVTCPLGMSYSGTVCTGTPTNLNWNNAVNSCAGLNSANAGSGYAGATDWRVPSIRELRSLVDLSTVPTWDTAGFSNMPAGGFFWSSTTVAANAADGHFITFTAGYSASLVKTTIMNLRCVRGTGGNKSFTDNANETITDNSTGLIWTQCTRGTSGTNCATGTPSSNARTAGIMDCESLTFAGRSDWRLPNLTEYHTILDDTLSGPPHDTTFFPGVATVLLTSSNDPSNAANNLIVDISFIGGTNTNSVGLNHRCVAGP